MCIAGHSYQVNGASNALSFQIVWADTTKLGCATQWCDELTVPGTSLEIEDTLFLVCNYGPG